MMHFDTALGGITRAMIVGSLVACGAADPALEDELGAAAQELGAEGQSAGRPRPPPLVREDLSVFSPSDLSALINDGFRFVAQTYTVVNTGVLSGVSVSITGTNTGGDAARLRVGLRRATDGVPSATNLTERTLTTNSSGLDAIVRFPNFVLQWPGDEFAIVVDYPDAPPASPANLQGYWSGSAGVTNGDLYPDGASAFSADGASWTVTSDDTLHFKTFVLQ